MPSTPIERVIDLTIRRCWVPSDLASVTVRGEEGGSRDAAERIWKLVEEVYRSGMHPAIQVCIRHHGDVVLDRAIGHARGNLPGRGLDPRRSVPLTVDTPVNLFSAAKAVTAMVMHKLEEQGVLSLDDPVADHLPGFDRHGKGGITIRHVLTHRSGIPALPREAFDLDLLTRPEVVEKIVCGLRPTSRPGAQPEYHAVTGGLVMEAVARRAAGRSLREVLAEDIKAPLGLRWLDFGVAPEHVHLVAKNIETGLPSGPAIDLFTQRVLGKPWGRVVRLSNDPRFLTGVIPSANVIVTARDVARFYQCLLDGGSIDGVRVFEEETVARALRGQPEDMVVDRRLGMPMRYGTGFMLGTPSVSLYGWNHPRAFGHVGLSNLFTWADPDNQLVVALLTTGKPVLGTHLPALVRLMGGIYQAFPPR